MEKISLTEASKFVLLDKYYYDYHMKEIEWSGHMACRGEWSVYMCWYKTLKENDHLEDLGVEGKIVLK